jgi:hypothetical protein
MLKMPLEGPDTVQILNLCVVLSNKALFDKMSTEGQKALVLRMATYEKKYGPLAEIIKELKKRKILR